METAAVAMTNEGLSVDETRWKGPREYRGIVPVTLVSLLAMIGN
jgi:hypothetical protein